MKIARLSIIGLGLIGASIARAARDRITNCEITGYDISKSVRSRARQRGVVHHATSTIEVCVEKADLIVIATPLQAALSVLKRLGSVVTDKTVVTDVCSTKRTIVRFGDKCFPAGQFVGSHPMFGSERSGIDHADPALVAGNQCLVTPSSQTNQRAVRRVEQFWAKLGMPTFLLSAESHDRFLATSSHLPQVIATMLMTHQNAASTMLSGRGLLDMTRLAGSDPALWTEIITDNSDNLSRDIRLYAQRLVKLAGQIEKRQSRAISHALQAGRRSREIFLKVRNAGQAKRRI